MQIKQNKILIPYLFIIGLFTYLSPVYGNELQTCLEHTSYSQQEVDEGFEKDIYLGLCYLKKDTEQGLYWLEKTANKGSFYAKEMLALLYEKGKGGLPKDKQLSQEWYTSALQTLKQQAQNNDPQVLYMLAFYYEQGRGLAQPDKQQAWYWYQQWAKQESLLDPNFDPDFLTSYIAKKLGIDTHLPEQ
ncbi:tetratricopeptide repeat protein [Neisseria sp. Ec49-e6-T10]|uniref:tetratricopeptide repeat protein n=1 Tax=Neisseria sp. Ec49-e6-T10 TaxID=3140744 RepID=UPI003EBF3D86